MNPTQSFLQTVPLFQSLPAEALEEVATLSRPRAVEEGGFFFMQGDEARYMYVLTAGRVKLTQIAPSGQQVGMHMVGPAQMFAAVAVMGAGKGYPVNAEAVEDSSALAWEGKDLRDLVNRYPVLNFEIMNTMRAHIEDMHARYRELSTERVEQRVARALLRLTMQMGKKLESGGVEIILSRQDLAEMSGTTMFSVSRILSEWERQGLIETGRERVVIRQPHELVKIGDDLTK